MFTMPLTKCVRVFRSFRCVSAIGVALGVSAGALALPGGRGGCPGGSGPDVVVGDIPSPEQNYEAAGGLDVFSFATYACNVGSPNPLLPSPIDTGELRWYPFVNIHPVIAETLYVRKKVNGSWRFEQLGQAWLKHGFFADQFQEPGFCCPTCTQSEQGSRGEWLGLGCADLYNAFRNGQQFMLGPKSEVNPHTGNFLYPFTSPPYSGNGRRLQIPVSSLAPSSADIQYFAEAHYVHPDDSTAGNQNNNASYRPVTVTGGPTDFTFTLSGSTVQQQSALRAWQDADPTVTEIDVQVPGDGLFIVSYQVTDLLNGWWHYEYAVQNLNADRAANSFTIPVPGCTQLQNIGFHDVDYRDGDGYFTTETTPSNYEGTDWPSVRNATSLTWSTQSYVQNPNANALRWGTTYNFRFDANKPPVGANATFGLYKRGSPGSMLVTLKGPGGNNPPSCPGDVAGGNGLVNTDDLLVIIGNWGSSPVAGDCSPPCGDGVVNTDDLIVVITTWGACP